MSIGYRNRKRTLDRVTRLMANVSAYNVDGFVLAERKRKAVIRLRRLRADANRRSKYGDPAEMRSMAKRASFFDDRIRETIAMPLVKFCRSIGDSSNVHLERGAI